MTLLRLAILLLGAGAAKALFTVNASRFSSFFKTESRPERLDSLASAVSSSLRNPGSLTSNFSPGPTELDYYAEHSIPSSDYQAHFDEWSGNGYILVLVTGFQHHSEGVKYNTIWHKNRNNMRWSSNHGMTERRYQMNFNAKTRLGYRPVFVDGFSVNGKPRINVIYHKEASSPAWIARHGQSSATYQDHFDDVVGKGYDLDIVSSYAKKRVPRFASLFSRYTNSNAWIGRHNMTSDQYQEAFDDIVGEQGYSLEYVSAGTVQDGEPRFAALFVKSDSLPPFVAFHNVSDVQAKLDEWIPKGYVPKVIDAYKNRRGKNRWVLLLVKVGNDMTEPEANDDTFPETKCFDEKIIDFLNDYDIPGASVAVLKRGELVYAQGYGLRDVPGIGNQAVLRKVSQCTPFRVASVSKPVTGLAILRLVQMGLLSLSDKVFGSGGILEHMADNPNACCPIADERILLVTVEHLLTHTGGWDDEIVPDPMFRLGTVAQTLGVPAPAQCEDVIYYMFGQDIQHDPGSYYAYSNFGYCILGRVIEEVTGVDYEEAVRQALLDPAGVSRDEMYIGSTRLMDIPEPESEYYCPDCPLVDSVFPGVPGQVPNPYGAWHLEAMDSHGAWVASAPQLMQMMSATDYPHCNGTIPVNGPNTDTCLLWDTSIDALINEVSVSNSNPNSWYGLGFRITPQAEGEDWSHGGSLPGTSTIIMRTSDGYAWTLLLNFRTWGGISGMGGLMRNLMSDAVDCVNDNWPDDFETECDVSPQDPGGASFSLSVNPPPTASPVFQISPLFTRTKWP